MTTNTSRLLIKTQIFAMSIITFLLFASPAFGAGGAVPIEDPAADATNKIASADTEYRWFYWPGWAFLALSILVIAAVGFFYYRNVLAPKNQSKKAQA